MSMGCAYTTDDKVAMVTAGGSSLPVREESGRETAQAAAKGSGDGAVAPGGCNPGPVEASSHPAPTTSARGE